MRSPTPPPIRALARSLARLVALAIALGLGAAAAAPSAVALETEEELRAKRDHWQQKYRMLLRNRALLKDNVAKLEKDYAQAQRRNYPRGGARAALLEKAEEQREQLKQIEAELAAIYDDARAAEVPPGWLAEVEDEPIDLSQPAAPDASDPDEDDGRNPLYRKRDDD